MILAEFIKLSLFVAMAFLLAQNSFPQKPHKIIESVDIEGNRRLADKEIFVHIKTCPGQKLDKKQLENDIKQLHSLGWFDATNTRVITEPGLRGGVNIIFEIREFPIIEEVHLDGLESFTKEQITADLQQQNLNIEKGDVFNVLKIRKVGLVIKKFLNERGFVDAKVTVFEEEVSATSLKIGFVIEERPEN